MSALALIPDADREHGTRRLRADLDSGEWHRRWGHLLALDELDLGYRVVTAQNGLQGIARFRESQNEIKLLVTDTDMPFLDGMGAIRAIRELNPAIPAIIASGYKVEAGDSQQPDPVQLKSLEKPYSLDQLLMAVDHGLHN